MKKLFIANCTALAAYPSPDVKIWGEIYNLLAANASLVDRSGKLTVPFHFELYEKFKLPTDLNGFTSTYEDCCNQRVEELLQIQAREQVPIALFYSGGVDSTLMLISFAKVLGKELRHKVKVFLSSDSIKENPKFYYSFVRKNCSIDSSEKFSYLFDGSHIIVGGEHNDQLFGSDLIGEICKTKAFDEVKRPYSRKYITDFFIQRGVHSDAANVWYDLLSEHAKGAPCAIETVFDFFWWLNFVFKWQTVYFRMLLRTNKEQHRFINQKFIDNFYHHFFSTPAFQKWAMLNKSQKIGDTWRSYKFHAKELIYEFNQDRDYLENKAKAGSLSRLFLQKNTAIALTSDYQFLFDLQPEEFYNPVNSFTQHPN